MQNSFETPSPGGSESTSGPAYHHTMRPLHSVSLDYKGRVADKRKTGGWKTASLVLGTELCERFAGFGVAQSLVTYLVNFVHLPMPHAVIMTTTFVGSSYMTFVFGATVADNWLGRFSTISIAIVTEFMGLVLLTFSATLPSLRPAKCSSTPCLPSTGSTLLAIEIGLALVAFGTGGIKACVSAFGADQFDIEDPNERNHLPNYFNWYFFAISCGGLLSVTIIVWINNAFGRRYGFAVVSVVMLVGLAVHLTGWKVYRHRPPGGSPMTRILQVMVAAFRNRMYPHPLESSFRAVGKQVTHSKLLHQPSIDYYSTRGGPLLNTKMKPPNRFFRFLDKAAILQETSLSDDFESDADVRESISHWRATTVVQVEEVKITFCLVPIVLSSFFFYTIYAQLITFSVSQSQVMHRRLNSKFQLPPSSVGIFLHIAIILVFPLYKKYFINLTNQFSSKQRSITKLQRIGIGLSLSILSMIVAALVETKRRSLAVRAGLRFQSPGRSPMSVFWLIPQFALVGIGEMFSFVGLMEFLYTESPNGMRSISARLFLLQVAFGYFSSALLVFLVQRSPISGGWLTLNLNDGNLENFYWLLAALSAINFAIYLLAAMNYRYRDHQVIYMYGYYTRPDTIHTPSEDKEALPSKTIPELQKTSIPKEQPASESLQNYYIIEESDD